MSTQKGIARAPQRFPTELEAQFRVYGTNEPWTLGRVVNLSETGACLEAGHESGAGDILELIIESIDRRGQRRKRIMCAKIIWLKSGKSGLEFVKKRRQA